MGTIGVRQGVSLTCRGHLPEDLRQAFKKGLDHLLGFLLNRIGVLHGLLHAAPLPSRGWCRRWIGLTHTWEAPWYQGGGRPPQQPPRRQPASLYTWRLPPTSQVVTAEFPRGGEKCASCTCQIYSQHGGGRAGWSANRCHSITDHRIGLKFIMKMDNGVLLLCYLDKICLILIGDFWQALSSLYSKAMLKKGARAATHPQSTILHSTGNTSVWMKEVSHSNTRGIVRLCSLPLKFTAAHSLHFQHLMWTRGY